jgi:hypothetical protein
LTAALERLAGDPELRRALGAAGRATVQRDYELARLADEMRAAFATPATAPVSPNR